MEVEGAGQSKARYFTKDEEGDHLDGDESGCFIDDLDDDDEEEEEEEERRRRRELEDGSGEKNEES